MDDEMWKAVVDCDENYDGHFFYAVKTVGVYCRPSCKSRTPLRKNVICFDTKEEAGIAGFRPCKRCRPDLTDYSPALELAIQTKKLMEYHYKERELLMEKMKQLGVSPGHLSVVFKRQYGVVPTQYLNQIRIKQAEKMLAETDISIIDIAGDTGFDSLSAFYNLFKRLTGTTPKKYRLRFKEVRL